MAKKTKTFDCVEMKRKAQEEIMAEYEARKHEFSSYAEYLEKSIEECEWASALWKELKSGKVEQSS